MNDIKKRTPSEWEQVKGIEVLDPDGWRADRKSWDDPISEKEWEKRISLSTVSNRSTGVKE